MHLVVAHNWKKEETEVAAIIADALGMTAFEVRQKIIGDGPVVLKSFADPQQAEVLADSLAAAGVPVLVVDSKVVRSHEQPTPVQRFDLGDLSLKIESFAGECLDIYYDTIELLLVGTGISGYTQTTDTVTERKFSSGKAMLTGGVSMTKKVKREVTVATEERDETLWLYPRDGAALVFDRATLDFAGLGEALQLTRDLNFAYLKNVLRRLAPQAYFDDRLLKRVGLVRLLGQTLSPEVDLDLAFAILARSSRVKQ